MLCCPSVRPAWGARPLRTCLLAALLASIAASTTAAEAPPAEPGPYGFVQGELVAADPLGRRTIHSVLVHPTAPGGGVPDEAPFPALVFSHGNGVFSEIYLDLLRHLATHGYLVVAPRHPGSQLGDDFPARSTESAVERPGEISLVLDDLLQRNADPASTVFGLVDPNHVGISGQSFGGYTTLAVRGGGVDLAAATEAFVTVVGSEPLETYCERVGWEQGSLTCGRIREAIESGSRLQLSDPRFTVGLPITPALYPIFGSVGIAEVRPPTLILAGELDRTVSFTGEILPMYEALPPTKYLVNQRRGGHVSNTVLCGTGFDQAAPADCPALLENTLTYVTAFLGLHLKGIESYGAFLTPEFAAGLEDVAFESDRVDPVVALAIEVQPWRRDDILALHPERVFPVAIFGSEAIDVQDIDTAHLTFGPDAARPLRTRFFDVDGDGRHDLVALFRFGETGLSLGPVDACVNARVGDVTARGCEALQVASHGCGNGHGIGWLAAGLVLTPRLRPLRCRNRPPLSPRSTPQDRLALK